MIFKNHERMMDDWWLLSPYIRMVIADVEVWCIERDIHPVWTCFMRTEEENRECGGMTNSVHLYGRGADMRLLQDDELNLKLVEYLNSKYVYDKDRPNLHTALIHGPVNHLHIQVLK
jgi:hypothetical protein